MVNDFKKSNDPELEELNERLAASNHHLQEMQEEHRHLLQEMETLRQRATFLTRFDSETVHITSLSSGDNHIPIRSETYSSTSSATSTQLSATGNNNPENTTTTQSETTKKTEETHETKKLQKQQEEEKAKKDKERCRNIDEVRLEDVVEDVDDDIREDAEFIKDKLKEIAGLKAQLKRVQNMSNTTKLIEEHMSKHRDGDSLFSRKQNCATERAETLSSTGACSTTSRRSERVSDMFHRSDIRNDVHDAKAELLETMTSMFTDYASDLRGQANSLREERERIRALKEKILSTKRQF